MKTISNISIAALIVLGTALTAGADLQVNQTDKVLEGYGTFSSSLGEQNRDSLNGSWTVASLFTYKTNQDKSYDQYAAVRSVLDNFASGYATTNKQGSTGLPIRYGDVKQIAAKDLTTTNGAGKHLDWLTPAVGTNNKGEGLNGFYAFKYEFDLDVINSINDYNDLKVILNLNFGADDHVEAVYLNGIAIKEYLPGYGTEDWDEAALLRASFDASEMAANGGIFAEDNELVFIVHNDGHNGQASGFKDGSNAFGFGGDGWIGISANADYDPSHPAVTPEPATLLIFGLGMAGLGFRRRFAK